MPVVQITAVPDAAKMAGVYRILEGQTVPCVAGNSSLTKEEDRELRRKYVLRAMEVLQMEATRPKIFRLEGRPD